MVETVHASSAAKPAGHYVQAMRGAGLVFTSMQLAPDLADESLERSLEEEVREALGSVQEILEAAGASWASTLHVTMFVPDIDYWDPVNEVYSEVFGKHRPARSVVAVTGLHKGRRVGVQAVATCNHASSGDEI